MASGGRSEHCLLWVPSRSQGGGDGAVLNVRLARHPVGADRRSAAGICRWVAGTPIGTDRPPGGGRRNIEKAPPRREFDWLGPLASGQVRTTVIGYSDLNARAAPVNSSCLVTTLAAASV